MAQSQKPETSPEDIQKAQNLWASFTVFMKYGVIATIIPLILMALFLV